MPTVAETEAGFYTNIDPVAVVSVDHSSVLEATIMHCIDKGNPKIVTPNFMSFSPPVLLRHANVKSLSIFERESDYWKIVEQSGLFAIKPGKRRPDRGWEDDQSKVELFPSHTTSKDIAVRVTKLIQMRVSMNK